MTSPTGLPGGPRRDGLARALDAARRLARTQADDVLGLVPDTGDSATGRAVDDFVEQAADALRALDETLTRTLARVEGGMREGAGEDAPTSAPSGGGAYRGLPEGWR